MEDNKIVDSFLLDRLYQSCTILETLITDIGFIYEFKWDSCEGIILRGMILDSIECLYVAIPAILKKYFTHRNINSWKFKGRTVILAKASWVAVLYKAFNIQLISSSQRNSIESILKNRGVLVHSETLTYNDYYDFIIDILNIVSYIDMDNFKNHLVTIYNINNDEYILSNNTINTLEKLSKNIKTILKGEC